MSARTTPAGENVVYSHEDFVAGFGLDLRDMAAAVAITLSRGYRFDIGDIYDRRGDRPDTANVFDLLTEKEARALPLAREIVRSVTELVWESSTTTGVEPDKAAPLIGEYLD